MVDELPVGKGAGGNPFGAENEQPPSAQPAANADDNKPLQDRLVSKTWAVRKTAFEELNGTITKFDKGTANDVMNEHSSKWPKYLLEPNPGALEKVLECFGTFIDRCDPGILASFQDKVYEPLIDKCLGAPKPNLKAKALDCMLLFFEVSENFGDETLEAFQAQLKSKKPKIALAAMQLLAALMTAYGIKKFSPARFTPQIVAAANSSDPKSRAEAMNCYKAIFLWIGEAGVQPFIDPLKEAQKVQLNKDFEALKAEKKDFKRKTRTEQEAAKAAAIDDAINAACEEEKKEEVIDVFDISAPKEILSEFGPDWATATLAIKKWNEKKEALDKVNTAADVPKLAPGDYSGLFEVLKKLAADPHVAVAQHAIKAIGNLAKGLRESFHDHGIAAVPGCFAKLKEKRIVEDILTSLDNIMMCCELGELTEALKQIKTEKTPLIKLNIAVFMERAIRKTYIDHLEDIVDQLAPLAVAVSDEKDAATRDQGLIVLGVLLARVPNTMEKYINGLIEAKKQKINAAKETVKISKYDKSEKKAAAAAAAAKKKAAAAAKAKPASKPASSQKKAVAMTFDDQEMKDETLPNDNVLDEVVPKKPTRPPPNIGKKPVKKDANADDGAKADAPPKGGPPARLAGKAPAAAAGSGTVKVIKADDIQEEDVGSGMGKDQAIEKVNGFYDASIVAKFEEAKWQDKVEGFNQLKAAIEELKPDKNMVEATCKFVKARMKDWKESNINLQKESVNTLICLTQHCEDVPKRAVNAYAPFLCDKIGDIKMMALVKEAYVNSAEFCSAKFVCVQVVKKGLTAKAPNNIKETCNLLGQLIEDFGAGRVAPKECIDFGIFSCNHANKGVRDASMVMLATLYKQLGEKINKFLDGVKPSTMQLIQAEFDKTTVYEKGEFQSTRQVRGEAAEAEQAAGGGGKGGSGEPDALAALESALPRADISKQLNAKLIKMFTEADWKLKVKGCETVQGILKDSGMRIQPDGIGDLMEQLKNNFKASNKAVLKQVILLMGSMAEATGQPIMNYNKKCFKPLLAFLGDKAALMRADVIATADKWCEAIGAEHVIQNMCTYLSDGNPEMRNECLKWISAHKEAIAKCEHPPMIKPLIMCLTDKSGPIRTLADEVIVATMGSVGFVPFTEGIRDLKPAVQQTVRPLLEKAKAKMIASNPDAAGMAAAQEEEAAPPTKSKQTVSRKTAVAGPTKKADLSKTIEPSESSTTTKKSNIRATAPNLAASLPPPKAEAEAFSINPGNKERRAATDNKSKWVHDDIKPQHVNAAKTASEQIFGAEVSKDMWSQDFKKHVKVIEKLVPLTESQPQDLMECVDVIFKWTAVKLQESSNTALQSAIYDFYTALFEFLIGQSYLFWDHEADVVIPLLCERSGNNNNVLKAKVKSLIKMCFEMHDQKKTLLMIVKYGATNKNLKSAGECLDEIATFLREHNSVPFGEQHIKTIAKLVDSKDASVRENAIQVLSEIYKVLDEDIWRVMGQVPLKVKGLLETRFRKVKGLGASSSNTNLNMSHSKAKVAPSPKKQQELTRSFNPGLKGQTPRQAPLKFNQKSDAQEQAQPAQQTLTRSFRPGTASQSNLQKSFSKQGFGQRPQTAMNQDTVTRQTMPPPTTNNQFQGGRDGSANRKTQALDFHPPQNEMHFMDDDEDLRQQIQEMEGPKKETLDPETQRQVDDIMKFISNLKYSSDLNKRVESLIALNDIIQAVQKHEKGIKHTANDLISSFTHVLNDIFERPRQDTPLRFAKYFVTIVNKTCQCPTIMQEIREQELYELNEQLLTRLLIDNLDKLGDEKEGEFILKNLNGSMLRCLENCNKTNIFCVLFNLLRRYKDNPAQVKLPGLIIKCLLKLSKILEKVINELQIERVLLVIHLYLISINHEQKTSNDEMGIRIVKTLVHEMVKVKRHSVLESYRVVEAHEVEDKHLSRWIKIILNTMGPEDTSGPSSSANASGSGGDNNEREINNIIAELKNTDQFQEAIPKLHNFLTKNPHLSLDYYIRELSPYFQSMIRSNLESYRNQLSDSGSTPNGKLPISQPPVQNPQDRPSFAAKTHGLGLSSQSSETKRFNFRGNTSASASGFQDAAKFASSNVQQPLSSRNAAQPGTGNDSTTSTDRINSYQSKLSSMREKFQQRKTLTGATEAQQQSKSNSMAAAGSGGQSASKNFNASFSAMNTSLQQRWKAVQTKGKPNESGQLANTMTPSAGNRFSTEVQPKTSNLSTSNNAMNTSQGAAAGSGEGGASNQELNKRLLELRSKLATLRK